MYRDIHYKHPRRPQLRGGRKEKPARSDLRAGKGRHHCTNHYHHVVKMWSMFGCMRQNRGSDAMHFQSGHSTCLKDTKVKLAWLPPRHRNNTIPFCCHWFRKLLYQANLHGICTRATTAMDWMLVSNSFEAIGRSFWLEMFIFELSWNRLNWMTIGQLHPIGHTFRQAENRST